MRACKDSQGVVDRARSESTGCVCEVREWTKLVAYPLRARASGRGPRGAYEARRLVIALCVGRTVGH
jgi:hypothetical protein